MKHLITISIIINFIIISITSKPHKLFKYKLRDFHIEVVGEDSVKEFHRVFPFIVSDDYVYLAYLQGEFYKLNPQQIINLIRYDYYKRTMSESIQGNWFR